MSTEYLSKKPNDLSKINEKNFSELLWWSYIFGSAPEHLLAAIDKVGNASERVKKYIKDNYR
jgi:hypothetical protein